MFLTAKNTLKKGDDNYKLSESTNKENNGKEKSQKKPYANTLTPNSAAAQVEPDSHSNEWINAGQSESQKTARAGRLHVFVM